MNFRHAVAAIFLAFCVAGSAAAKPAIVLYDTEVDLSAAKSNGQVLTYDSTSNTLKLTTVAGTGDVVGPGGGSTDHAAARWDTATGALLQDGPVIITDAGAVTGVTSLVMGGALSGVTTLGMGGALTGVTTFNASGLSTTTGVSNTSEGLNTDELYVQGRLADADGDLGSDGQVLTANAAGTVNWETPASGATDVTAAATIDATAVVVGDDGSRGVKKTSVLIDGSDNVSGITALTIGGALTGVTTFNASALATTAGVSNTSEGLNTDELYVQGRLADADGDLGSTGQFLQANADGTVNWATATPTAFSGDVNSATSNDLYDSTGDVLIDDNAHVAGNLGVGASPAYLLDVSSSGETRANFITSDANNSAVLTVLNDQGSSGKADIRVGGSTYSSDPYTDRLVVQSNTGLKGMAFIAVDATDGQTVFMNGGTSWGTDNSLVLEVDNDAYFYGNVGVGGSPSVPLDVTGNTSISVDMTAGDAYLTGDTIVFTDVTDSGYLSGSGQAFIRYNAGTLEASVNGGAWTDLAGAGSGFSGQVDSTTDGYLSDSGDDYVDFQDGLNFAAGTANVSMTSDDFADIRMGLDANDVTKHGAGIVISDTTYRSSTTPTELPSINLMTAGGAGFGYANGAINFFNKYYSTTQPEVSLQGMEGHSGMGRFGAYLLSGGSYYNRFQVNMVNGAVIVDNVGGTDEILIGKDAGVEVFSIEDGGEVRIKEGVRAVGDLDTGLDIGATANRLSAIAGGNETLRIEDGLPVMSKHGFGTLVEPDTYIAMDSNSIELVTNGTTTTYFNNVGLGIGVDPTANQIELYKDLNESTAGLKITNINTGNSARARFDLVNDTGTAAHQLYGSGTSSTHLANKYLISVGAGMGGVALASAAAGLPVWVFSGGAAMGDLMLSVPDDIPIKSKHGFGTFIEDDTYIAMDSNLVSTVTNGVTITTATDTDFTIKMPAGAGNHPFIDQAGTAKLSYLDTGTDDWIYMPAGANSKIGFASYGAAYYGYITDDGNQFRIVPGGAGHGKVFICDNSRNEVLGVRSLNSTDDTVTITNQTRTGDILVLKDNTTEVFSVKDGGEVNLAPMADPTTPVTGSIWYSSDDGGIKEAGQSGVGMLNRTVSVATADSSAIASTDAKTYFDNISPVIYAGELEVGSTYRIKAWGTIDKTASPNITIGLAHVPIQTESGADDLITITQAAEASADWQLEGFFTVQSTGAGSGTWRSYATFFQPTAGSTNDAVQGTTLDTTVDAKLRVFATWSASSPSNTITMEGCVLQKLN